MCVGPNLHKKSSGLGPNGHTTNSGGLAPLATAHKWWIGTKTATTNSGGLGLTTNTGGLSPKHYKHMYNLAPQPLQT